MRRNPGTGDDASRKGRLRIDALEAIRGMIVSGELVPGARLREVALSAALGMSRTPIREAFRTLAAEGLVTLLPNRSVVVSMPDPNEAEDVLVVLDALADVACRLACRCFTKAQIAVLGALHAKTVRWLERGDRTRYLEASRAMREHVVRGTGNGSLIQAWTLLLPRAERARATGQLHDCEAMFRADCAIVAAISARDEDLLGAWIGASAEKVRLPRYAEA